MTAYLICWKPATENKEQGWPEEALAALYDELNQKGEAKESWRFVRAGAKLERTGRHEIPERWSLLPATRV